MSDTWPPTQLERLDAEKDQRVVALEARVAELEQAALNGTAVEDRVAELEKLVGMMRHVIDVAVLRVEPYPDDSKSAQFSRPRSQQEFDKLVAELSEPVCPDIDDSPLAPAE